MNDMGWFGGGTGPLFMLLFWGLVILGLAVALVRWLAQSSSGKTREKRALDILAMGPRRGPQATTPGMEAVERSRMPEPRDGLPAASRSAMPAVKSTARNSYVHAPVWRSSP